MNFKIFGVIMTLTFLASNLAFADDSQYVGSYSCKGLADGAIKGRLFSDDLGISIISKFERQNSKKETFYQPYPRLMGNAIVWVNFAETDGVVQNVERYSEYLHIDKPNLKRLWGKKPFAMSHVLMDGNEGIKYSCKWDRG